jgi:hypothetical protein
MRKAKNFQYQASDKPQNQIMNLGFGSRRGIVCPMNPISGAGAEAERRMDVLQNSSKFNR